MAQNNENTEQSCSAVTLCSGGCGFFGNTQFDGMCSKCYKDALKRKQATIAPPPAQDSGRSGRSSPLMAAALRSASAYLQSIETGSTTVPTPKSASSSASAPADDQPSIVGTDFDTVSLEGAVSAPAMPTPVDGADQITDSAPSSPAPGSETKSKKRNRCSSCKKKVGLTGFECRCGGLYCSMHRYSDKHDCQFDYKKEGEHLIRKNNPVVVGSKVQKI